jgi:hypothetical protein
MGANTNQDGVHMQESKRLKASKFRGLREYQRLGELP